MNRFMAHSSKYEELLTGSDIYTNVQGPWSRPDESEVIVDEIDDQGKFTGRETSAIIVDVEPENSYAFPGHKIRIRLT